MDISEFNFSDVYVDAVDTDGVKCKEDEVFTDDDWMKVLFFIRNSPKIYILNF